MRGTFIIATALAVCAPAIAQDAPTLPSDETLVENAANRFFDALRGQGNYELADVMHPDGTIMISDRMHPEKPTVIVLPNAAYLASQAKSERSINEVMDYDIITVRDGVGQIWGPYRFMVEGKTTHCGINSMTFIETEEGFWQLGNTSFTMVPPDECGNLDAPPAPEGSE